MDPYQLLPRGKASRVESRSIVDTETTASTGFTTDCSLHPHHLRVGLRPSSSQCCTIIAADLQVLDLAVINRKTSGPSDSLLAQTWGLFGFQVSFLPMQPLDLLLVATWSRDMLAAVEIRVSKSHGCGSQLWNLHKSLFCYAAMSSGEIHRVHGRDFKQYP